MNVKSTSSQELRHKLLTVFSVILCLILLPVLIINCTLLFRDATGEGDIPSFGGYFPLIVLTDSMSGTFESGDLIICRTVQAEEVKVGDVIVFFDPAGRSDSTVTHRVVGFTAAEDGSTAWITRGDANNTDDRLPVTGDDLAGIYLTHLSGVGRVALFMQTTKGFVICAGVPILLFLCCDMLRRRRLDRQTKQETEALIAELERLRAERAETAGQTADHENREP